MPYSIVTLMPLEVYVIKKVDFYEYIDDVSFRIRDKWFWDIENKEVVC